MTSLKRPILLRIEPSRDSGCAKSAGANALANGFDGVEIALGEVEESPVVPSVRADAGVIVVASACRSTDVSGGLVEVSALLRLAATCRATCLNLTLPPVDGGAGGTGFSRYQDGLNFAYRVLYDLRHEAQSAGVDVAIEAAAGGCLLSPVELREIINQANSPAVGVCLDVARVSNVGVVEDWIATLGYRIQSVRVDLSDGGELDSWVAVLNEVRYQGPVIVHGADDPSRFRAAVARLSDAGTG